VRDWKATKFALGAGILTSGLLAARKLGVLTDRPALDAPLPILILGELFACLSVGVIVDLGRLRVRNRWQAAVLGMVAWLPVMLIGPLIFPTKMSFTDFVLISLFGSIFIGGFGGAVIWHPSDAGNKNGLT